MHYERAANLLEAEVGDDLLGLDVEGGSCFGFNSVAASVWRLLDTPRSFDELQTALMDEYEVEGDQCAAELRELIDRMVKQGLVREAPPAAR